MRRLAIGAIVVAAFLAVLAVTLPIDGLLRTALARVPLPSGVTLDFAAAHLRPGGLVLDDVVVTGPDGHTAFTATWVRVRPSLWGFLRGRMGRPWSFGAAMCQGAIDATVGGEGKAITLDLSVRDVEIASCAPYLRRDLDAYGHVSAEGTLRVPERDPASGSGTLAVRGFGWQPGGPLEDTKIRADAANARWDLADRRLTIETADAAGPDFKALGHGSYRWTATSTTDGALDLLLAITPGRSMPPMLRRIFDAVEGAPPGVAGARTFRVQGTLGAPRVTAVRVTE